MIGTPTRLVISLTPDRLRGAAVRAGRVVRAEQVEIEPGALAQAWEQGLVPLDRPLRQLFARLARGGTPRVTLLYNSVHAVVQADDVPGSRDDATQAAIVRVLEAGGHACIADARALAPSAGKPNAWKTLAAADREEDANRLYAWVTRCGGRLDRLVPEVACVIQAAANRVLRSNEDTACCYIGPGWSAVACGSRNGILLLRSFEFGHRLMSDVFQRAMAAGDAQPDRFIGETTLFEHGLPFKAGRIDPELRSRILPMVAPVLQRFCVEIKQTLRFGLPPDHDVATLTLDGPGAAIPHLGASVTDTLNTHVRHAPGAEARSVLEPFAHGTLEHELVRLRRTRIGLIPRAVAEQRTARKATRCMAAGAAVAAGLLGAELWFTQTRTESLAPDFEKNAPQLAALTREEDTRTRIVKVGAAADAVVRRIATASGPSPDWVGLLALMSETAGDAIRFDDFEARASAGAAHAGEARVRGVCAAQTDSEVTAALTGLVERFQQSPLVSRVELGSTSRESAGRPGSVRAFTLTLRLNPDAPLPTILTADATTPGSDR